MPRVSIVIPFYNCPFIDKAIESALNQSYKNVEVIVVNDGSTEYSEKIIPYMNKIRYIEKANGGTASALNLGIKNSSGDYFAWLSSDDLFCDEKIEKQLAFMREKNAFISYTNYSTIDIANNYINQIAGENFTNKISFLKNLQKGNHINGCAVMLKMQVFSSIGTFNEKLKFTQDYDFWLRAVQNYEFYYLSEPLVKYRVHDRMGSRMYIDQQTKEIQFLQEKYNHQIQRIINKEKDNI
ncbi:glycosyltransferase [Cytobacillus oceanisediminis]|uniref:glycosyltransferase family 2 protein n=1 Tax=Cytobacillus TaxID=2675230 RepID=UPI00203CE33B|nr:glycosyltransferase [Cytobacillus oceanisediminis]MBY0159617.1 glycosyltransferase [Cytobacillus firmus]MCM3527626.1 glycosyltransferase [Cytobacillus oceanisediminis]